MSAVDTFTSLAHCVQLRAMQTPDSVIFRWFNDFDRIDTLSWSQLHARAGAIASEIRARVSAQTHIILCVPQGLEFIEAIFGIFYAGCTAVPIYPPDSARAVPRFQRICSDSEARLLITTHALAQKLEKLGADMTALPMLCIEDVLPAATGAFDLPCTEQLALLQYTSGTTAAPKGVMITHADLLENERAATRAFPVGDNPHLVSWLPFYHDLGLIGGIFFPVFNNIPSTLMSPATFLRNPATWLRVISDTRATLSGGPNFAFELCAARIADEVIDTLDLSCWRTALCGAEMIRQATVEKFISRFARAGFAPTSFSASYGMAETTLYVSSTNYQGPQFATLDHGSIAFASCGDAKVGHVTIVDPQTKCRVPDDTIGEIWIKTPSVASGYWRQPELSQQVFNVALADNGERGYFRSGDLGFMRGGNLYVTGRLKELIIVRGKNYSPLEIEAIATAANPAFAEMQCAAFAVDNDLSEKLIVVQEVKRRLQSPQPLEHLRADIRLALRGALAVEADDIVLVKQNSLPRTSSGKLQRLQIRALYQQSELDYLSTATDAVIA